jgi:anti-anti-sigma factor
MNMQHPDLPPALMFSARQERNSHVISLADPSALEAPRVEKLGEDIFHYLQTFDAPNVVLDLRNIELMSSSALGVLISLNSLIENEGGRFCLANVSSGFRQILKMTKLEGLIRIHESMAQALDSLK